MRIRQALASLPALIPQIVTYKFGSDLGAHGPGNMDFAIVATFESVEAWQVYDTHPDHDRVRSDVIRPWIAERATVQFDH